MNINYVGLLSVVVLVAATGAGALTTSAGAASITDATSDAIPSATPSPRRNRPARNRIPPPATPAATSIPEKHDEVLVVATGDTANRSVPAPTPSPRTARPGATGTDSAGSGDTGSSTPGNIRPKGQDIEVENDETHRRSRATNGSSGFIGETEKNVTSAAGTTGATPKPERAEVSKNSARRKRSRPAPSSVPTTKRVRKTAPKQ